MKELLTTILIIGTLTAFGQTAQDNYNKGNEKADSKDFVGSIKDYDKAIKLNPKYTDAYYNRATSKIYIKDYKGAIADYNRAIELRPDFLNAFTNRGVAKLNSKDLKGAVQDFDSAIKLDPANASAYFMRGQVKLQSGETEAGCGDLKKSKELGDNRADKFLEKYCGDKSSSSTETKINESLMIDWPDAEGWKVASQQDNAEQNMIELLRNEETFDNWTEIGTMFVYKKISSAMNIPITKTMDLMFDGAKKNCPRAKLTMIEKDDKAKYPWIIFKIECGSSKGTESQVWYAIQGTNEMFVNFRAVKQKTIPADLQDKWVKFFKTAKIVTQ
jgi:tetratricopeptide (TPR) repeat protein